jgi:hypothetical protein
MFIKGDLSGVQRTQRVISVKIVIVVLNSISGWCKILGGGDTERK